jgi:hypothetical protein
MSTLAVPLQAGFILLLMLIVRKKIGFQIIIIMIIINFIICNIGLLITEQKMSTGHIAGTVEQNWYRILRVNPKRKRRPPIKMRISDYSIKIYVRSLWKLPISW